jgi:tyrosinase
LSWRYQAALHGIESFKNDALWSKCRHNSWFFFAWHRMYLYRFESIIQHHLGDPTWALPYWDYTKPEDEARKLPLPFREPQTNANSLYVPGRSTEASNGTPLGRILDKPRAGADAGPALRLREFAVPRADASASFGGGIVKDTRPDSDARGALENRPHASMHGAVGGLMGAFATAALDPVFWLHHANIDRLWEVWRGLGNANPSDSVWLDTLFTHYDVEGKRTKLSIREVLDIRGLGYEYESTAPPSDFRPAPPRAVVPMERVAPAGEEGVEVPAMPSPELVGAVEDVSFAEPTTVPVELVEPVRQFDESVVGEDRWFLRVENIHGDRANAAAYAVLLEPAAPGEDATLVGTIGAFGIVEASRTDDTHDGTGITDVFDITEHVQDLKARQAWDSKTARVTISPVGPSGDTVSGDDVRAGRVSFYRG